MAEYSRKSLGDGIGYTTITDPKFKTERVQVTFLAELDEKTASENAMAVGIMGSSNSRYKNISEITAKLNSLYGANINIDIQRISDIQKLGIGVSSICNRYALEGEDISAEVISVLLECIFSPNVVTNPQTGLTEFAAEPFDFRKKDLLDSIDAEINNKRGYALIQAYKSAYKGEPCANTPSGTRETAMAVTPQSAYEAYKRLIETAQIEIYYVGPCENPNAEKMISEAFSKSERHSCTAEFYSPSRLKDEVCRAEESLDVNQCKMVMAFKTDSEDYTALKLMNTVFGATPFSKLFMNVREKLSLCYYCASRFDRFKRTLFVDCGIEEENLLKTEKEIINQLEEIQKGNFSDEDVKNSVLSLVNSLKGVGDTASSYINWYFSCFACDDMKNPQQEAESIAAVTRERIIEAAESFKLDTVYVMRGE